MRKTLLLFVFLTYLTLSVQQGNLSSHLKKSKNEDDSNSKAFILKENTFTNNLEEYSEYSDEDESEANYNFLHIDDPSEYSDVDETEKSDDDEDSGIFKNFLSFSNPIFGSFLEIEAQTKGKGVVKCFRLINKLHRDTQNREQ